LGGFQGRPGKLEDVCYSFWIGATIKLLEGNIDHDANRSFLLSAQSPIGGFGKDSDDMPDPYHSYLALAALAMSPDSGLKPLDALWNVSEETASWLQREMDRVLGSPSESG
jgi:geranylgeranyl transferase type-1 subunit beta